MKQSLMLLAGFGLLASASAVAAEPIITLKTNIYGYKGAQNQFTIELGSTEETYVDVDCGSGEVEYKIKPATLGESGLSGTRISCTVKSDGVVKIYGDASKIESIYAEGCYLNSVDLGDCTNIWYVNFTHNELTSLDLSKYTQLASIEVGDNAFTKETPLIIGNNHPDLQILDMSVVTWLDPAFDITTFPNLQSFDAYGCATLAKLDPTKCPKLLRISVDSCPLTSLDVTKNPLLRVLNIEDSGISSIDISKNTQLTEFYAVHASSKLHPDAKLRSIDVSNNTELVRLALNGNLLTDIDVSKNTKLIYLNVGANLLTGIDVSKCTQLGELDIYNNYMTYATMPLPAFATYNYWQLPIQVDKSYQIGHTFDFSDKVLREGTETKARLFSYSVKTGAATEITDASAFSYDNGKLTVNRVFADSLYVQFDNNVFAEWPLTTSKFMVKSAANFGKPSKMVTAGVGVDAGRTFTMSIGMDGATAAAPVKFFVDLGDGVQTEFSATSAEATPMSFTKKGPGYVTVYAPEGEVLTAFGMAGVPLTYIDVTAATELRWLSISDAGLYDIDLAYNRCLKSLDLSGNNFTGLTLAGVNGNYNKNVLSHIDISDNKLADITLNDTRTITHLDLSNNLLTTFGMKDFDNIVSFNVSNNKIASIDLSYMTVATDINVSGNMLTEVLLPETNTFATFDIRDNCFTLADLPEVFGTSDVYKYAPQQNLAVPTKGPGIDLTLQNRVINGRGTSYVLRAANGSALLAGKDYEVKDGRVAFLAPIVGQTVYCDMTNPNFPGFDAVPFRTSDILAAAFPTNCVAEFVTPVGGQTVELSLGGTDGAAIYFDWNGQGTDLSQYPVKSTYTRYNATTVAGAHVKVYTYEASEKVTIFSISGATMSSLDMTNLTDAYAVTIQGAGLPLEAIKFTPDRSVIRELVLDANAFTSFDPSLFPSLTSLALSSNALTSLDLSKNDALQLVSATHNKLTDVKLGNRNLWFLSLGNNNLASIDLSGVPAIEVLGLGGNLLKSVDVTPLNTLKQFVIDRNYFTFTTLPPVKSSYIQYTYGNQANLDVTCDDGQVDLSSQARVGDNATSFRWFLGEPIFDDNGELQGEELEADDEFVVKDGVTTFMRAFNRVQCVMTNAAFPDLYLRTNLLNVTAGIDDVTAGTGSLDMAVTIDNGTVTVAAAVADGTPAAIYTLDGRMAGSAVFSAGRAVIDGVPAGVAVLTVGNTAAKIAVK